MAAGAPEDTPVSALASPSRADVSLLASAGLLQVGANAAAAVVATIVLGPAGRGEMVLGTTIGSVCALLGGLGTGQALRSALPVAGPPDRERVLRSYAWCTAGGAAVAAGLAAGGCAVSSSLTGLSLSSVGFLVAVAAATAVQVVAAQASEAWYADGLFRPGGLWSAACAAGGLVTVTVAAVAGGAGAAGLLAAQAAGTAVVCLVQLHGLGRIGLLGAGRPEGAAVRLLVGRGAPALGLTLGLAVALRSDRYVLGAVAGPAAVGVYSVAATLSEVSRVVPQAVGQFFVRHVALGGSGRLNVWVSRAALFSALGGVVVATAGWVLVVPVFGMPFAHARELLLVLVVAETCLAPYVVASRGLVGGGRTRVAGAFGLAAGVASVGCYVLGVKLGGSMGLAVSCVALYCGLSAVAVALFRGREPR
ncbi:lipopolysaccharide biosynthesis protein [Actinophytocola sp.]|uniref:lipopolysaccharide biosynthesis protein n=1 Tax=Actinophytocola sp. TaxID=1872138 RepID=UPI002D50BFE3|nr:oligosaccharide flippase family protein [Actinophytocola sp.]HYQ68683.1 oligosaccharide flippase family protein [Actinophytocola sp.]